MSRFVNLEFGDEHEDQSSLGHQPLTKDEAHYFSEARAAFENGRFEPALRLYSKVLEFNPAAERMFGYAEELLHQGSLDARWLAGRFDKQQIGGLVCAGEK